MPEPAQEKANWSFHEEGASDNEPSPGAAPADSNRSISWTASEYIMHEKGTSWYIGLAFATAIVAAVVYWISDGDILSIGVIILVAALLGVLAGKHPRELSFTLDSEGLTIADKVYPYSIFKSYAVHSDGSVSNVNLIPLKRFMPDLSVYLPPSQQNEILEILSDYLPHDQRPEHIVDRLMKRVRF